MAQMMDQVMEQRPGAAASAAGRERRAAPRGSVIKSAKIVVGKGSSVYDCLVLDESASGVLVDLGTLVEVPEDVVLHFGGATYPAHCVWSVGTKAGFTFTGGQIVSRDDARRMRMAAELMDTQGLGGAMRLMRAERFYDNAELRRLAEEAEAAQGRLQAALLGRPVI